MCPPPQYLVSVPLKMFRLWAFMGMAAQVSWGGTGVYWEGPGEGVPPSWGQLGWERVNGDGVNWDGRGPAGMGEGQLGRDGVNWDGRASTGMVWGQLGWCGVNWDGRG